MSQTQIELARDQIKTTLPKAVFGYNTVTDPEPSRYDVNSFNDLAYSGSGANISLRPPSTSTAVDINQMIDRASHGGAIDWYHPSGLDYTGATDNTTILNTAAAYCVTNGLGLALSAGTLLASGALTFGMLKAIKGPSAKLLKINSGVIGAVDAMTFTITGYVLMFPRISGFELAPVTPGNGRYGIRVILNVTSFWPNYHIADIYVGDFGSQGLYLDNSIANLDGFFLGVVERCRIENGILGVNLGDSIVFRDNQLFGNRTIAGVYPASLDMTVIAGAAQQIISGNSMTCRGGSLNLTGGQQASIENNQMEHPEYLGAYIGTNAATVWINNAFKPRLLNNSIYAGTGTANAIKCAGTTFRPRMEENVILRAVAGTTKHVSIDATVIGARWHRGNHPDALLSADNLSDSTEGIPYLLGPKLLNGWTNHPSFLPSTYIKDPDTGRVHFQGAIQTGAAGNLFSLPSSMCPSDYMRFSTQNDVLQMSSFASGAALAPISIGSTALVSLDHITWRT